MFNWRNWKLENQLYSLTAFIVVVAIVIKILLGGS